MKDSQVYHYLKIEVYSPNVIHGKGSGTHSYYSIPNGNFNHIKEILTKIQEIPGVKIIIRYEKN